MGERRGWYARLLAGFLVVLGSTYWFVTHCGSGSNEVIVHVKEENVEVTIGDQAFYVGEQRFDPIVTSLPLGRHTLIMRRGGEILFQETFEVESGQGAVRTAYDTRPGTR